MSAAFSTTGTGPSGVSVVIPAYNYAHFLPHAIDSVLRQTHTHHEIIVIDDGSTDNTPAVIQGYGDRVRYIRQPNAGLPAARNTGIRAARFDYVAFLDADDGWLPDFLDRVLKTFAQMPDDYAIVACRAFFIGADGQRLPMKQLSTARPREVTCQDILLKTRFGSTAVMAKKSAFEKCGFFDETLRSSEDRDMWMRIAARYRIHVMPEQLVLIRRHSGSMSGDADRMKANMRRVIQKGYQNGYVPKRRLCFWLQTFSFYHFQCAWMYWSAGRPGPARQELVLSLFLWPWFTRPRELGEPNFFRFLTLLRFILKEKAGIAPTRDAGGVPASSQVAEHGVLRTGV